MFSLFNPFEISSSFPSQYPTSSYASFPVRFYLFTNSLKNKFYIFRNNYPYHCVLKNLAVWPDALSLSAADTSKCPINMSTKATKFI